MHRTEYYPKLTQCLDSKYEKNRNDIYTLLKPNTLTAIENAKSVLSNYNGMPPSQCTPGTTVFEIFEKLQNYII